jgi:uncharacterized membrane protein
MAQNVRPVSLEEADQNDRLFGLLAYIIGLLVPAFILLNEQNKARPFQRYHAVQSLVVTGVVAVLSVLLCVVFTILGLIPVVNVIAAIGSACLMPLIGIAWLGLVIWYGVLAYQGKYFEVPQVTAFARQQGWL